MRKLPKYEAGIGFGLFHLPDYPGSDESRLRWLPLPYFIYRGDILRADREGGVRGRFIKRENFEFDMSFDAAFNASARDNRARSGMEDIDWIGEAGPRIQYHLLRGSLVRLTLQLPVRWVFSNRVENWQFVTRSRGFTFNPEMVFTHRAITDPLTFYRASLGGTWATEKLMDYFYEVPVHYVTPSRPQYDAQEGFLATNASLSAVRMFPKYNIAMFLGVSFNFYQNAKNRLSPLLTDRATESYVFGLVWTFFRSKEYEE